MIMVMRCIAKKKYRNEVEAGVGGVWDEEEREGVGVVWWARV